MPINDKSDPKSQWKLRITDELREHLGELGRPLNMTGNEFAVAVLELYADVLAEFMTTERAAHHEVSEEHRQRLREWLQSTSKR